MGLILAITVDYERICFVRFLQRLLLWSMAILVVFDYAGSVIKRFELLFRSEIT